MKCFQKECLVGCTQQRVGGGGEGEGSMVIKFIEVVFEVANALHEQEVAKTFSQRIKHRGRCSEAEWKAQVEVVVSIPLIAQQGIIVGMYGTLAKGVLQIDFGDEGPRPRCSIMRIIWSNLAYCTAPCSAGIPSLPLWPAGADRSRISRQESGFFSTQASGEHASLGNGRVGERASGLTALDMLRISRCNDLRMLQGGGALRRMHVNAGGGGGAEKRT